jgi:prephenate dehydrogenase
MLQNLTIIGLGLLGGSIGLAAKGRLKGVRVTGCAHREGSLVEAQRVGAIDRWTLDVADAVREADLVVLCMPVSVIPDWIERCGDHLKPGAIVTDVGSTKNAICTAGVKRIRKPAAFVGSHPMAGSEKKGVGVARADLFDGSTCIVTPVSSTPADATDVVTRFWQALGCRVVTHAPDEHDKLVAMVSHLPHATAAALMSVQSDASLDLRGKGFADATRIAAGDAELWRDIFVDNADHLVAGIEDLIDALQSLRKRIRAGDAESLRAWLEQQAKRRAALK